MQAANTRVSGIPSQPHAGYSMAPRRNPSPGSVSQWSWLTGLLAGWLASVLTPHTHTLWRCYRPLPAYHSHSMCRCHQTPASLRWVARPCTVVICVCVSVCLPPATCHCSLADCVRGATRTEAPEPLTVPAASIYSINTASCYPHTTH